MADELGAIEKELSPFQLKIARREALKKALRGSCVHLPAEEPVTIIGARFLVVLGACGLERKPDLPALIKTIGAKAYSAFATTTLTALEFSVSPEVFTAVVKSSLTGPRSLKCLEKGVS